MSYAQIINDLERRRDAITRAIDALRGLGGTTAPSQSAPGKPGKKRGRPRKRKLSAEGRAKIIEAAKKRWARVNAEKAKAAAKKKAPARPVADLGMVEALKKWRVGVAKKEGVTA